MRYYLYSKTLDPARVLEEIKFKKKRHPAITAVAELKPKIGIHYKLSDFADKYLDGGSGSMRWIMAGQAAKRELFREYMSLNQEREDWNNFGIIGADGSMFEPLAFIAHAKNVNNQHRKTPHDNRTT